MQYRFGDYTLDTSRWELRHTGMVIKLRPKVFDVLSDRRHRAGATAHPDAARPWLSLCGRGGGGQ
jgi:hypothetical protein